MRRFQPSEAIEHQLGLEAAEANDVTDLIAAHSRMLMETNVRKSVFEELDTIWELTPFSDMAKLAAESMGHRYVQSTKYSPSTTHLAAGRRHAEQYIPVPLRIGARLREVAYLADNKESLVQAVRGVLLLNREESENTRTEAPEDSGIYILLSKLSDTDKPVLTYGRLDGQGAPLGHSHGLRSLSLIELEVLLSGSSNASSMHRRPRPIFPSELYQEDVETKIVGTLSNSVAQAKTEQGQSLRGHYGGVLENLKNTSGKNKAAVIDGLFHQSTDRKPKKRFTKVQTVGLLRQNQTFIDSDFNDNSVIELLQEYIDDIQTFGKPKIVLDEAATASELVHEAQGRTFGLTRLEIARAMIASSLTGNNQQAIPEHNGNIEVLAPEVDWRLRLDTDLLGALGIGSSIYLYPSFREYPDAKKVIDDFVDELADEHPGDVMLRMSVSDLYNGQPPAVLNILSQYGSKILRALAERLREIEIQCSEAAYPFD